MTTNSDLSYQAAVSTAIRALENSMRTIVTPEALEELTDTIGDFHHLLTVLHRDWLLLRKEEAELVRQAELAKSTPTEPDTESIF